MAGAKSSSKGAIPFSLRHFRTGAQEATLEEIGSPPVVTATTKDVSFTEQLSESPLKSSA